jgi:hypothetical protein
MPTGLLGRDEVQPVRAKECRHDHGANVRFGSFAADQSRLAQPVVRYAPIATEQIATQ